MPPLVLDTPPLAPEADQLCPGLLGGLPLQLDGAPARPVRSASPYAVAWGEPPVVLRCGVPPPAALGPTSQLIQINQVAWLAKQQSAGVLWTAVNRAVYVDVLVPPERNSDPVAVLSTVLAERLPVLSAPSSAPTPTG
ncbi:MAG: DUF3515 family protein [Geodermatophilaceae bacterium]